jgi:hypothetical protein
LSFYDRCPAHREDPDVSVPVGEPAGPVEPAEPPEPVKSGKSAVAAARGGPLSFVPYHELGGRPNVIVDGSPADGTVLCLTHWPGIGSPPELQADLSAEMAFRYLRRFDRHGSAAAVSNNHFDQDGLVSVYALAFPEQALARQRLLTDVARAGDFATFDQREAARVSMVIAAYATPGRSPLGTLTPDYPAMTAQLYEELLGRLGELCDHPDRYRALWAEEDATLSASEAALASGKVSIEEVAELDLAVVTVAGDCPRAGGHRFGGMWAPGLHPMALYNATQRFAVLVVRGQSYEFTFRYETWVQYQTSRPRPRVDLTGLADRLNREETGPGRWVAEPVSDLTPALRLDGAEQSGIAPRAFRTLLEDHLRASPPAWDPYRLDR